MMKTSKTKAIRMIKMVKNYRGDDYEEYTEEDSTTMVEVISGYLTTEIRSIQVSAWCFMKHLPFKTAKRKNILLALRKGKIDLDLFYINNSCMERVQSIIFLGVQFSGNLSWTVKTMTAVKTVQHQLHFLKVLSRKYLEEKLLVVCRATMENILTCCIIA